MKQVVLTLAAIAILGNAAPQQRAPVQVDEIRANCPLTVTFGSYAMGIDSRTYDATLKLLLRDRAVVRLEQRNWGREGEKTLCAVTRKSADARRLFARVKALFPRKPRGPLTVALAGVREYHSPQTRR
ncbi:MAG: hypothetical protein ACAH11_04315 [Sphingomonas sp.]